MVHDLSQAASDPTHPRGNPLVILAETISRDGADPLKGLGMKAQQDMEHRYGLDIAELPQHGRVWGSYCIACSALASQYVYPCKNSPEEQLKPPPFFTIGRALVPRDDGAFEVYEGGLPTY